MSVAGLVLSHNDRKRGAAQAAGAKGGRGMEDRRFRNRLVAVLCEEWEKATPGPLPSEAIYERLVGE
ncbi:MAG: hypothetical protein M3N18_08850, partial [Actinomycetota bacterium]|nr:hypothetical protein [Actinomycetota bacterium]